MTYYDPKLRKALGVFYTPVDTVRYLVGMVDHFLAEEFHIEGGLSNNSQMTVTVQSETYRISKSKYSDKKQISVPRVAILEIKTPRLIQFNYSSADFAV